MLSIIPVVFSYITLYDNYEEYISSFEKCYISGVVSNINIEEGRCSDILNLEINNEKGFYKLSSTTVKKGPLTCTWGASMFNWLNPIPKPWKNINYLSSVSNNSDYYPIITTEYIRKWIYTPNPSIYFLDKKYEQIIWDFKECELKKWYIYTKTLFEKEFDNEYKLLIKELDNNNKVVIINWQKITDNRTLADELKLSEEKLLVSNNGKKYKEAIEKTIKQLSDEDLIKAYSNFPLLLAINKIETHYWKEKMTIKSDKLLLNYFWNKIWLEVFYRFWK